eukprot:g9022.t1
MYRLSMELRACNSRAITRMYVFASYNFRTGNPHYGSSRIHANPIQQQGNCGSCASAVIKHVRVQGQKGKKAAVGAKPLRGSSAQFPKAKALAFLQRPKAGQGAPKALCAPGTKTLPVPTKLKANNLRPRTLQLRKGRRRPNHFLDTPQGFF